ncbi:MAG: Essential protein Yae1, N terminal [Chrysothrix sp. TS-e1954]|nr:MAG: Essential protein Yae1, N terminal [Chrysothrix sp. TS-e1954]
MAGTPQPMSDLQRENDTQDDSSDPIFYSRTPSPNPSSAAPTHPSTKSLPKSAHSDLPHLIRTQRTDGYRAGISAGRDHPETAQAGFDSGYVLGGVAGVRVGWLLGCMDELVKLRRLGGLEAEALETEVESARRELGVKDVLREGAEVVAEEQEKAGDRSDGQDRWLASLNTLRKWEERLEELGRSIGVDLKYPCAPQDSTDG